MDIKGKIEELRAELHRHNYNYYVLNTPEISDKEFDDKMRELQDLELAHPEYKDENSPTMRVGSVRLQFLQRHFQIREFQAHGVLQLVGLGGGHGDIVVHSNRKCIGKTVDYSCQRCRAVAHSSGSVAADGYHSGVRTAPRYRFL